MLSIIDARTHTLPEGQYRREVHPKRHIVLHFTAGFSAGGALSTWKNTSWRDGTAFVLERDGTIYQAFDPRYWAVHIYRHKSGEPKEFYDFERQSIGIEIVNVGPLHVGKSEGTKDALFTYTNKRHCDLAETDRYVRSSWKGRHYWQSFTYPQYESLRVLLRELERDFQIPVAAQPLGGRLDVWDTAALAGYRGVTTHCNYRKDKYDVGPAFEWEKAGLVP
jgi:N-acetyl-anhydromuramyl-L-alanine amidase AmpD